jgi:hypothetical protein
MKTNRFNTPPMDDLELRAIEALRALLGQVSVIKLKEIRREPHGPMLARVDVLGHSHTLACDIEPNGQPDTLRAHLRELHNGARQYDGAATPVLIAPYLSPEAQAVCKECSAGFLDLQGNARLALGEFFIGKRTLTSSSTHRTSNRTAGTSTNPSRRLSPSRATSSAGRSASL